MRHWLQQVNVFLDRIWPPAETEPTPRGLAALVLLAGLILGWLTQNAPWLGHDWLLLFHDKAATDLYYPPWTSAILAPLTALPWRLGLALLNGISIASVEAATLQQGIAHKNSWRLAATLLAVVSFQMAVLLWLGHIDGLALLGLIGLPWLAPLLLMKATFAGFAVFARKTWFLAALIFAALSLLLWPGWPQQLAGTLGIRNTHPSAAGWAVTGWLPAVAGAGLLLLSKRTDWLQMVAAGSLMYPFLLPYHFLILLPALGAMRGVALLATWLAAWLMLLPVGLNAHHWLYFVFPFMVWFLRYNAHGAQQSWLALLRKTPV